MPSWWVHRLFAHELGLDVELSRIVDEIIDFAHILPDKYKTTYGEFKFPEGVEKRHDWVKFNLIKAEKAFKQAFGAEAVRAMILHMILDYIYENKKKYGRRFDVNKVFEKISVNLRKSPDLLTIANQIIQFLMSKIDYVLNIIEIDIDPSNVLSRCDICGNKSEDLICCEHCGTLFPGLLWIIFLEEIRELKDRIANPTYGIVTSIDRRNEMLTIRLFSEPKDFDEGTIVGCVIGNRVEKIGKIIYFDKIDNEITVDFSELKIPEWLEENTRVKLANAENLIGYQLQEAWILEARRNFKGLYDIITEILKSSLSDESKQELKESLETIIRNAESAIKVLRQKEKERISPVDFEDKTSLSGFELDNSQIDVIRQILGLKDNQILIIVGPPGTGKTEVIAKAAYELVKRCEKVLITSHTNIAVDNALEKLADKEDIEIVRVGRPEKISDKLKKVMLSKVRYERAPKDLVDEIRELEQEIQSLKEKLRKLKDLRRELKETEKSKLDELLPRINEVLGNKINSEVIKLQKRIIEIDAEIKRKQEYIEKHLLPIIQGGRLSFLALKKKERLEKRICELKREKEIYLRLLEEKGARKLTKKSLDESLRNEIKEKTKELIDNKERTEEIIRASRKVHT